MLALSGVARVFHTKHQVLQGLGDFARAWAVLLDFIQNFALCQNHEVSLHTYNFERLQIDRLFCCNSFF